MQSQSSNGRTNGPRESIPSIPLADRLKMRRKNGIRAAIERDKAPRGWTHISSGKEGAK